MTGPESHRNPAITNYSDVTGQNIKLFPRDSIFRETVIDPHTFETEKLEFLRSNWRCLDKVRSFKLRSIHLFTLIRAIFVTLKNGSESVTTCSLSNKTID